MSNFKKLIPAVALVAALSPFAVHAITQQHAGYLASAAASQVAANSKGRPAEFTPVTASVVAANSKGRPAEYTPAPAQLADNSKGRPAEFVPPAPETPFG